MSTGDNRLAFYEKQNLGLNDFKTYWFDFMDNKVNDVASGTFLTSGILDDEEIGLTSSANDTLELDITNASKGVDSTGRIMDISLITPTSLYDEYWFENTNLTVYYVGFRHQNVPSAVERNPRSSEADYSLKEETIGELGHPDSVTDNATSIRLVIDGILENGVDHKNRPIKVYLENPVSVDSAIAFYTATDVEYLAGVNYIDIPYTGVAGPLGQTTPEFAISTTATDYWVHVQGISWFKNADLRIDGDYVFVGLATGSGALSTPFTFDTTDQVISLYISLDRAYRGGSSATPAPGRTINVDKFAVEFAQSAVVQRGEDPGNASVVFNKFGETINRGIDWRSYLPSPPITMSGSVLKNLSDAGAAGTDLFEEEDVTLGVGTRIITFTRSAIDLTTFDEQLGFWFYILVTNGPAADNGLYACGGNVYTINTATVTNLDGTNPSFAGGGSPKAKIFLPVIENFIPDYHGGTWDNSPTFLRTFAEEYNGYQLYMLGSPTAEQRWHVAGTTDNASDYNEFYSLYFGRILMRGGGYSINEPISRTEVIGNAQFQSDKVSVGELHSAHRATEASNEWGFDYRGTDFAKATSYPGHQFAATFRHPFTRMTGDLLRPEEAFSRNADDILELTRGGTIDISGMPGSGVNVNPTTNEGMNFIIAEVQFSPPHAADGVYLVYLVDSVNDRVTLRNIDGTAPNPVFGAATSGVIRFYGGMTIGTPYGALDVTVKPTAYLASFVCPTIKSGAFRIFHAGSGWTADSWHAYAANVDGFTWGLRDGGVMYSKAITTRSPQGVDPSGADEISTGTLKVGRIDIDAPAAKNSIIDIFKGQADLDIGTLDFPLWLPQISGTGNPGYIYSNFAAIPAAAFGFYFIPIYLPDGDYINSVEVSCKGVSIVAGKEMGINLFRKHWTSTAGGVSMLAAGTWSIVTGIIQETLTFTPDGISRLVDNTLYMYYLSVRSTKEDDTSAAPDFIYGARVNHRPGNGSDFTSVLDKLLIGH